MLIIKKDMLIIKKICFFFLKTNLQIDKRKYKLLRLIISFDRFGEGNQIHFQAKFIHKEYGKSPNISDFATLFSSLITSIPKLTKNKTKKKNKNKKKKQTKKKNHETNKH